jgi:5-methylcytosine-specific restriction endonuclease McrA
VLLLDVSYRALHLVSARRAVTLLIAGKAELVETDPDGVPIRSARLSVERASVIRLVQSVRLAVFRTPAFTRRSLIARDGGVCQFVGCDAKGTTIEHVLPRSRGGGRTWCWRARVATTRKATRPSASGAPPCVGGHGIELGNVEGGGVVAVDLPRGDYDIEIAPRTAAVPHPVPGKLRSMTRNPIASDGRIPAIPIVAKRAA